MSLWLFLRRLKKWKERPLLPRAEHKPVSTLDEIVHSDWYEPRKKPHGHRNQKHTKEQDKS